MSETEKRTVSESPVRPPWIRVRGIRTDIQREMTEKLCGCNTVCLSAKCPNLGECFRRGVATFMIGGAVCTRACRFCGIRHGHPEPLDAEEPHRVAESVKRLGLNFVVVTGVARDDLADGGAGHYARTVRQIRQVNPGTGVEVLIPDFGADEKSLGMVLDATPDILNHNVETVRRLTPQIRSRATYEISLRVLELSRKIAPGIPTKSGLMVGLGEEKEEVLETFEDLIGVGCSFLTVGQYLQPRSGSQLKVERYWTPGEFEELGSAAKEMGFKGVASGPFVRSSYFAEEMARSAGFSGLTEK